MTDRFGKKHSMASPIVDRVKHLTDALERVTTERERLAFEVRDAQAKERELKVENEGLRSKLTDSQFKEQELCHKRESLQRQLDTYMSRVVELSEQRQALENMLGMTKGAAESLSSNHEVLASKLEHLESESSSLEHKAKSTSARLADREAQIEILRKEGSSLRDRLFESESEREALSSSNKQLESALKGNRDKYAFVEGEKDIASRRLEETNRERNLFSEEISLLKKKLSRKTLRILVIGATVVSVSLYAIWAYYTVSSEALNEKLTVAKGEIAGLQAKIDEGERKLAQSNSIIIEKRDDVSASQDIVSKLQEDIVKLKSDMAVLADAKDDEIRSLKDDKEFLQKQHEGDKKALQSEQEIKVAVLQQKIEGLNSRITMLNRTKGLAIPPLIDALTHQDLSVRVGVSNALSELTQKSLGTDPQKWQEWWTRNRTKFER